MGKLIFFLFGILFFFTPLIFWPYTSEVFELNKIVFVYIFTILIVATWLARTVLAKKFIFRRTILDIPLLIFIASQILSTIFSIDPRTSLFGYYSRFNGGLTSTLAYSLLYWAYVSNIDYKMVVKHIYILFASSAVAAGAAVLEHFGIFLTCGVIESVTTNCWVQDVQLRVFSTFGQPNWLATWIVALAPLGWALISEFKSWRAGGVKLLLLYSFSLLLFVTLLFTGSRSGLLGFGASYLIFWSLAYWKNKKEIFKPFVIMSSLLLIISLVFGTQFTPSLSSLINHSTNKPINQPTGPALETGGTESGIIRKIVWKGAISIWKHYPIFGSGLETFAYSYYGSRPAEHNLVSEWDFIYNKAHNEFLNMAANSGTIGLLSYLTLIGFSLIQISNYLINLISKKYPSFKLENSKNYLGQLEQLEIGNLRIALTAGYVSILVTNFFGFSVVPTQLLFFLFPAMAVALKEPGSGDQESGIQKTTQAQKMGIVLTLILASFLMIQVFKFLTADINYAKGKVFNGKGNYLEGIKYLTLAINTSPNEPLYHNEIAQGYTLAAIDSKTNGKADDLQKYVELAVSETQKAVDFSPSNLNLRRTMFGVYIRLFTINPEFLIIAKDTLIEAVKLAPTDAKLIYNLGLTQARIGEIDNALENINKTIGLKSNYREARLAKALLLIDKKDFQKARDELNYILEKLDPNDSIAKQTLEEIKNQ